MVMCSKDRSMRQGDPGAEQLQINCVLSPQEVEKSVIRYLSLTSRQSIITKSLLRKAMASINERTGARWKLHIH